MKRMKKLVAVWMALAILVGSVPAFAASQVKGSFKPTLMAMFWKSAEETVADETASIMMTAGAMLDWMNYSKKQYKSRYKICSTTGTYIGKKGDELEIAIPISDANSRKLDFLFLTYSGNKANFVIAEGTKPYTDFQIEAVFDAPDTEYLKSMAEDRMFELCDDNVYVTHDPDMLKGSLMAIIDVTGIKIDLKSLGIY